MLLGLRDGLRSGDVYVPGSRRYADPAAFLLTPEAWAPQRPEFCRLVGKPAAAADALAAADEELHAALADLETQLTKGNPGEVRLTSDGELVIPPLTAEDVPAEADALRDELAGMLPRVPWPRRWWRSTHGPGLPTTSPTPAGRARSFRELVRIVA